MANRSTEIGRLARRAPDLARIRIKNAIRKSRGCLAAAGRILDISDEQLRRYVLRFLLEPHVRAVRAQHGYTKGLSTRVDTYGCLDAMRSAAGR